MSARTLALFAVLAAGCTPAKDAPGLWQTNIPALPVAAAGWSGGAAADGTLLAFHREEWSADVQVIGGGASAQIAPEIDGGKIVWADQRNGAFDLFVYDIALGTETEIAPGAGDVATPALDGDWVVYARSNDIYAWNLVTSTSLLLAGNGGYEHDPVVSGDRACWLDSTSGYDHLFCTSLTSVAPFEIEAADLAVKQSPSLDGDLLVWERYPGDVVGWNFATSTAFDVAVSGVSERAPSVDGGRVAYESAPDGNADIFVKDLASGVTARITDSLAQQTRPLLKDGYVYWVDSRTGSEDLYAFDLAEGFEIPVATTPFVNDSSIDADGDDIVYSDGDSVFRTSVRAPPAGSGLYSLDDAGWTFVAAEGRPFTSAITTVLDGVLYECGPLEDALVCASFDGTEWSYPEYDPAQPVTTDLVATTLDGSIYLFWGGSPVFGVRFSPSEGTWTELAQTFVGGAGSAAAVDGRIALLSYASSSYVVFDPFANTWAGPFQLGTLEVNCGAVAAIGDELFVVSGADTLGRLDLPKTGSTAGAAPKVLHKVSKLPSPRFEGCPVSDGSRVFVLGGYADGTLSEEVDAVDAFVP